MALLLERHPHYHGHGAALHRGRSAARRCARRRIARSPSRRRPLRGVLHVHPSPRRRHRDARARADRGVARAAGGTTSPSRSATAWQVEEHRADGSVVTFDLRARRGRAVARLRRRHLRDVRHRAHPPAQHFRLPRRAARRRSPTCDVPYGYTVHDLNFACPTITFLDADGHVLRRRDRRRASAGAASPRSRRSPASTSWRGARATARSCARAAFLIAPSQWAAAMLARYFPGARRRRHRARHAGRRRAAPRRRRAAACCCPTMASPIVAVLGAIGPDKGARRLERLVDARARARRRVRFVLIGYLDVEHGPWQSDDARVHRARPLRRRATCRSCCAHYRVALVLYPSAGPETFSYTLSEAWARGQAGARAADRRAGRARARQRRGLGDDRRRMARRGAMLDRIVALARSGARDAARAAARARACDAAATLRDDGRRDARASTTRRCRIAAPRSARRAFDPARVRDALGYRPWTPPARAPVAASARVAVSAARARVRCMRAHRATRARDAQHGDGPRAVSR